MVKQKLRILFLDFSTSLDTIDDLKTKARGGMISSLFHISNFLSTRGHDVEVLSDIRHSGLTQDGVKWYAREHAELLTKIQYDALIINRGTGNGYAELQSKHRILWTHDLPHNGFAPDPKIFNAFSAVVFMSRYAESIWRTFFSDIGKSFIIPNGVDKTLFHPRLKDTKYIIFASAPNRGLKRLSFILDAIRARLPEDGIYMKAFSSMSAMHPNEAKFNDYSDDWNKIKESDVDLCEPLPQEEFAKELGKAGLMIIPSDYPEICSNVILQSLASGTPVITTGNLGSAGEWISNGYNGVLTKFQPHDYMVYTVEIVRNAVNIFCQPSYQKHLMYNAERTGQLHSWEEIGSKWETMLDRL